MARKLVLTVAVAALIATAGCAGVLGDGGGDTTPENFDYPDGLSESNIAAEDLLDHHESALDGADSATVEFNMEVSSENSSVETISVSKMEGDERLITLTGDALGTESFTQHVYFDGETTWRNQTVDGDSTVEQLDESPGFPESGAAYRLANVLRAGNYSATAAESDNGTPTVTYTADSFDNRTAIAHLGIPDPVTALSATVTVTADGLVTSAALTVEREADQRSDTWTYEYDVRGINETTVETPDWAA